MATAGRTIERCLNVCKPCQSKRLIRFHDCTIGSCLKAFGSVPTYHSDYASHLLDPCIAPVMTVSVQQQQKRKAFSRSKERKNTYLLLGVQYVNAHALIVKDHDVYGAHVKLCGTISARLSSSASTCRRRGTNRIALSVSKLDPSQRCRPSRRSFRLGSMASHHPVFRWLTGK